MKRAAAFSGIQICAYAAMDNHFHVVCKVVRSDVRLSEDALLGRVAQIGGGKIFGSESFVRETMFALGDKFRSRHLAARAVEELGYATHGWRLAKTAA